MRILFRIVLGLYGVFLVACAVVFATDHGTGGPYNGIGKALAAFGAGLPWTLLAFWIAPRGAGPTVMYVFACVAALANLLLLAHFAGWRIVGRR